MNFVDFVIDNCNRQKATEPKDYIGMTRACTFAQTNVQRVPLLWQIMRLAAFINNDLEIGWRTTPVTFANGNVGLRPEHIDRQMKILLAAASDLNLSMTADEFYHRFEEIHPFVDGNGRVGAILYNCWIRNGTRDCAEWVNPPEMEW